MSELTLSTLREDIRNFFMAGMHPNEGGLAFNVRACFGQALF